MSVGARLEVRLQAAEFGDIGVKLRLGLFGDRADRFIERQARMVAKRARIDLVVDIGDVAGISDVIFAIDMTQQPEQHVEDDDRPGIADMSEVIDGRAADIHADIVGIDRRKHRFFPCQRVVQLQFRRRVHFTLPNARSEKYRDRRTGAFRILTIWETKTAGPALALANNLPADNADNRFHGGFYGPVRAFGQGGEARSSGNGIHPSDESIVATNVFETSWHALEIRPPFSAHKSRIAS